MVELLVPVPRSRFGGSRPWAAAAPTTASSASSRERTGRKMRRHVPGAVGGTSGARTGTTTSSHPPRRERTRTRVDLEDRHRDPWRRAGRDHRGPLTLGPEGEGRGASPPQDRGVPDDAHDHAGEHAEEERRCGGIARTAPITALFSALFLARVRRPALGAGAGSCMYTTRSREGRRSCRDARQHLDQRQGPVAGVDRGGEDVHLGDEPRGGGYRRATAGRGSSEPPRPGSCGRGRVVADPGPPPRPDTTITAPNAPTVIAAYATR